MKMSKAFIYLSTSIFNSMKNNDDCFYENYSFPPTNTFELGTVALVYLRNDIIGPKYICSPPCLRVELM